MLKHNLSSRSGTKYLLENSISFYKEAIKFQYLYYANMNIDKNKCHTLYINNIREIHLRNVNVQMK